jgi:hypothetical protein
MARLRLGEVDARKRRPAVSARPDLAAINVGG